MACRLPTNPALVSVNKESDAAEYSLSSSGFSVGITDRHTQNIHHSPNTHIHLCEHTHKINRNKEEMHHSSFSSGYVI